MRHPARWVRPLMTVAAAVHHGTAEDALGGFAHDPLLCA